MTNINGRRQVANKLHQREYIFWNTNTALEVHAGNNLAVSLPLLPHLVVNSKFLQKNLLYQLLVPLSLHPFFLFIDLLIDWLIYKFFILFFPLACFPFLVYSIWVISSLSVFKNQPCTLAICNNLGTL